MVPMRKKLRKKKNTYPAAHSQNSGLPRAQCHWSILLLSEADRYVFLASLLSEGHRSKKSAPVPKRKRRSRRRSSWRRRGGRHEGLEVPINSNIEAYKKNALPQQGIFRRLGVSRHGRVQDEKEKNTKKPPRVRRASHHMIMYREMAVLPNALNNGRLFFLHI